LSVKVLTVDEMKLSVVEKSVTFMADSSKIVSSTVNLDLRNGLCISFHSLALSLSPVVAAMAASIT